MLPFLFKGDPDDYHLSYDKLLVLTHLKYYLLKEV